MGRSTSASSSVVKPKFKVPRVILVLDFVPGCPEARHFPRGIAFPPHGCCGAAASGARAVASFPRTGCPVFNVQNPIPSNRRQERHRRARNAARTGDPPGESENLV